MNLTIATRESPLALWQAKWVQARLISLYPDISIRLLGITTQADKMLAIPLTEIGGKGSFVKELEEALLNGRADIAVHSMKDVPMELPVGLCLPVICEREDPRDVLVGALPHNAIVGTSSLRRQSQLRASRPDIRFENVRGNVNTRLSRLDKGDFDALVLAAAGLKRLGLEADREFVFLSTEESLPAAGQGALGIECRADDSATREIIERLNHIETNVCVTAERAMCRQLGGGCQVPVAAFAEIKANLLELRGLVARADGSLILRSFQKNSLEKAEQLGIDVARDLLSQGAEDILRVFLK